MMNGFIGDFVDLFIKCVALNREISVGWGDLEWIEAKSIEITRKMVHHCHFDTSSKC